MWRGSEWFMGCCGLASPDNAYSAAGTQTKLRGIYTRTIAAQIVGFNCSQLKIVLAAHFPGEDDAEAVRFMAARP
jgi:hypothetical protein